MIDYEKLKIANDLAADSERYYFKVMMGFKTFVKFILFISNDHVILETHDIDELIDRLKGITKDQPKYKINEEVWIVVGDEPFQTTIVDYFYNPDGVFCHYEVDQKDGLISKNFHEDFLYSSPEALILSQIQHWYLLLCQKDIHQFEDHTGECAWCGRSEQDLATECTHISDGRLYRPQTDKGISTLYKKCVKCGEYFND